MITFNIFYYIIKPYPKEGIEWTYGIHESTKCVPSSTDQSCNNNLILHNFLYWWKAEVVTIFRIPIRLTEILRNIYESNMKIIQIRNLCICMLNVWLSTCDQRPHVPLKWLMGKRLGNYAMRKCENAQQYNCRTLMLSLTADSDRP